MCLIKRFLRFCSSMLCIIMLSILKKIRFFFRIDLQFIHVWIKNSVRIFESKSNQWFIVLFNFSIDFSIIFVKKNDSFRLRVNYRKLNAITIKNRYFLFLISQLFVLIQRPIIFTKLNFRSTYHSIRIRKNDELKNNVSMSLRTLWISRYILWINQRVNNFSNLHYVMLKEFFNFFVIIYLNDILIFFKSKKKRTKHVRLVLNKFRTNKCYINFEKC